MKKLLILFGLNNLIIALHLAYPLWSGKEQLDFTLPSIFLCSIISLFIVTAVGLPLRNQFAWSANFILSALVVILIPYGFFLIFLAAFHVSREPGLELNIWLLGRFIIMGVAFFSIIRTLRQDVTQLLQITKVQKRLTVVAVLLISVSLGWTLIYFTSMFKIFADQ